MDTDAAEALVEPLPARERCDCGKAVYHGPSEARDGVRGLQRSRRDGGGGLHVYRCDLRRDVWHIGHHHGRK